MITEVNLHIREAKVRDRGSLSRLVHFETLVHRHLDWRQPLEWLGKQPYLVEETGGRVVAALACPRDPPEINWIRLFVCSQVDQLDTSWALLWERAREMLKDQPEAQVAAIPQRDWFRDLLEHSGFRQTNEVITMIWDGPSISTERHLPGIRLRRMQPSDLETVQQVDAAAFKPAWRNSLTTLTKAYQQAATAIVAEDEQGIVAYQISSITPVGGHLSRLATHPRKQGRGIGSLLVRSLLADFLARGVTQVTVNTQKDNLASISLYSRIGFRPTGEGFPYYQYP